MSNTVETRHYAILESNLTRAAEDQPRRLEGYAAVFDSPSQPFRDFTEIVKPGAFARSLSEAASGDRRIHALWSHRDAEPLGSTASGKLVLREDAKGLWFSLDTSRFTAAQISAAEDGDLRMSFGFNIREQSWTEGDEGTIREVVDVDLYEVSPVINPAYPDTSAALRSLTEFRSQSLAEAAPDAKANMIRVDALKRHAEARAMRLR